MFISIVKLIKADDTFIIIDGDRSIIIIIILCIEMLNLKVIATEDTLFYYDHHTHTHTFMLLVFM